MATIHHPTHSSAGTRGALDIVAIVLVALPVLAVVGTSLVAVTGRWGGLHDSLVSVWFIAMTVSWVAAPGALLLLIAHRGELLFKRMVPWAVLAPVGWVLSLGSAAAGDLMNAATFDGHWLAVAGSALGVTIYVGASTALAILAWRARNEQDDDWY